MHSSICLEKKTNDFGFWILDLGLDSEIRHKSEIRHPKSQIETATQK